ncbi:MAG: hypothetical protein ACW98D_03985 [Promethearchaeota archaeon]|jgi:hypothetical protein
MRLVESRVEFIPEYSMEIEFSRKSIQGFDLISKKVVCSKSYRAKIAHVEKVTFNSFLLYDENDEVIDGIYIDLVSERSRVATGAQYIRDLYMDTPTHGYYFGTYELGEFSLIGEKLVVKRSYPIKYCSKGIVTPNETIYFGLRESETEKGPHSYFLVKLDWNKSGEPLILWKKSIPSPVMGITRIEDKLYLGLKTGIVQIWDIEKNKLIKTINLYNNPISTTELGFDSIIVTSWKGEIGSISPEGNIQWRKKFTDEKIDTILGDINMITFTDIKGNYFQLNSKTGNIIEKGIWNLISVKGATTASNLINFRDWFVLTGYGGVWAFWKEDYNKIFHHYLEDPLIRKLYPHPLGFYTGDDTGYIRFWKIGGIRSGYRV